MKNNLLLLFVSAFFIRLVGLTQSLWLDEATTAKVAMKIPYSQIIPTFSRYDFHPPLYYFFMKVWVSLFGSSEIALRMPSIIFSLIAGYAVFKIGKLIKNEAVGFWAAILFLFNPLVVYYSQEARMYMMVTCFLMGAFYFYLRALRDQEFHLRSVVIVNVLLFLSFMTFYGSIFFISGLFIWSLFKKRLKTFFTLHIGFFIAGGLLLPLLYLQYQNAHLTLREVTNWSSVLGNPDIKNLLLFPIKFSVGKITFFPKIVYLALASLWSIVLIFLAWKGQKKEKILSFILLYPIMIAFVISFITPLLQYFRFLYLVPIFMILVARGVYGKSYRMVITGVMILLAGVTVMFPQFYREDWIGLQAVMSNQPVYIIDSFKDPLEYYANFEIHDLRAIPTKPPTASQITVIPYGTEIYGFDYKTYLSQLRYHVVDVQTVRGLVSEEWRK